MAIKKIKLQRDKVVTMTKKGGVVGVYIKYPHIMSAPTGIGEFITHEYSEEILLAVMSPESADAIIEMFNKAK